ncbi:MAG: hypothetical protein ACO1RA_06525 [Planctomycetaceae bacterium]
MKRLNIIPCVLLIAVFFAGHLAHGRGPGGGGGRAMGGGGGGGMARPGGGGGGMPRPSGGMGHSPSFGGGNMGARPGGMPAQRPNPGAGVARPNPGNVGRPGGTPGNVRPGGGANVAGGLNNRPSAGQLDKFLDMPRPSTGAIAGNNGLRPGAGGAAGDFLRNEGRPSQLPAGGNRLPGANTNRPNTLEGDRRQNISDNRAGRIDNRQEWQGNRQQRRDEVRDQVNQNHPRFDFWTDHPNWAAWRINQPYRWATWAAVGGWIGASWTEPVVYNYGENVYYDNSQVYNGDQAVASSEEYAQQAAELAASSPEGDAAKGEWLPLGVFALTQDGKASGPEPTLYMQLAISKQGEISGTLKNVVTGQTQALEGMIDKKSQRAAWTVQDKQYPIVETGIENLTKDTAPALLHFADGQTQQWLMVHLEEPK